jgi:hypothetical protein
MSTEVTVGVISAVATIIAAALPLYVQNRRLRQERKLIATGLAVAYYYSFITKLFELINDPTSILASPEDDGKQQPPKLRGAKLRIYFPPDLDEGSLADTSLAIRSDSRAGEIRRGNDKPMRVNFVTRARADDDTRVVIVADFPTILDAASKHYSGMIRTTDFSKSETWKATSAQELSEFKSKIQKMVDETRLKDRVELVPG